MISVADARRRARRRGARRHRRSRSAARPSRRRPGPTRSRWRCSRPSPPTSRRGRARAAILWPGADWRALGLAAAILAPRPRYVLAGIGRVFERPPELAPGIHPSAVIDPSATIGARCRDRPVRGDRRAGADRGAGAHLQPRLDRRGRRDRRRRAAAARACGSARGCGSGTASSPSRARCSAADGFSFVTPDARDRRGGAGDRRDHARASSRNTCGSTRSARSGSATTSRSGRTPASTAARSPTR